MTTTFIIGPMFAGKSTLLYDKICNARDAILICPEIDSRDKSPDYLYTHNGKMPLQCKKVFTRDINNVDIMQYDNIFISEGQFHGGLEPFLEKYHGVKNIICDGLITDYQQKLFGDMFKLSFKYPDIKVITLTGVCHKCGNPSTYTIRKSSDKKLILIGSSQYDTSCAGCLFKN